MSGRNPPEFVIFGPHGEFFEPFGRDILLRYGTKASPFTRKVAAKLETEKGKELKLEMLCDQNTIFRRKDGPGNLLGSQLCFFMKNQVRIVSPDEGSDDEFEVIHTVDKNDRGNPNLKTLRLMRSNGFKTESFASVHIGDFPWLLVSLGNDLVPASFDGRLVRRPFYPTLEDTNFPFGDAEQETLKRQRLAVYFYYFNLFCSGVMVLIEKSRSRTLI